MGIWYQGSTELFSCFPYPYPLLSPPLINLHFHDQTYFYFSTAWASLRLQIVTAEAKASHSRPPVRIIWAPQPFLLSPVQWHRQLCQQHATLAEGTSRRLAKSRMLQGKAKTRPTLSLVFKDSQGTWFICGREFPNSRPQRQLEKANFLAASQVGLLFPFLKHPYRLYRSREHGHFLRQPSSSIIRRPCSSPQQESYSKCCTSSSSWSLYPPVWELALK